MGKISKFGLVLVTVGALLATMGVMLKFYAYDKLATIPLHQSTESVIIGENAEFFDADNVAPGTGDLTTTARVIANEDLSEEASDETDTNAVVVEMSQSTDNNDEPPPMDYTERVVALDRFTGLPVEWSGNEQNGQPTDFEGQVIKWPFNTQKKSYEYWDGTLGESVTMEYVGVETVEGSEDSISTYKFETTIPETEFGTREVPRGLFGLEDTGAVQATRTYANERTIWVEPETGVMIKIQEKQFQRMLLDEPGAVPVVALDTTSVSSPQTIDENIAEYAPKVGALKAVRTWAPLLLMGLGALLLVVGIVVSMARARKDGDAETA